MSPIPRARKDNRGGARQGTPGGKYENRSDLRAPKVLEFRGQPYGERTAQVEQQQAALQAAPAPTPMPAPAAPMGPDPGSFGGLLDPTARPDEPLTAGMPFGPGPGPEAMTRQGTGDPDLDVLRAIYAGNPSMHLLDLIREMEG